MYYNMEKWDFSGLEDEVEEIDNSVKLLNLKKKKCKI